MITVKEAIEKLQKLDPKATLRIYHCENGCLGWNKDVTIIDNQAILYVGDEYHKRSIDEFEKSKENKEIIKKRHEV